MILRTCLADSRYLEKTCRRQLFNIVVICTLLLMVANHAPAEKTSGRPVENSTSTANEDKKSQTTDTIRWLEQLALTQLNVNISVYIDLLGDLCTDSSGTQSESEISALLSSQKLPFCDYLLALTFRNRDCFAANTTTCRSCVLARVLRHDLSAAIEYQRFEAVLNNYDCGHGEHDAGDDEYDEQDIWSNKLFTCSQCAAYYKEWLCSVKLKLFLNSVWLPPCPSVCRNVAEACPFFVPEYDDGSGEPLFLCSADDAVVNTRYYSKDNCYRKCNFDFNVDFNSTASQSVRINLQHNDSSNCNEL